MMGARMTAAFDDPDDESDLVIDDERHQGYFDKMTNIQKQAFDKLYENTLEGPCSALVACEQNLEQNLNEVNCQQLMFWNNNANGAVRASNRGSSSSGGGFMSYHGPGLPLEKCEYCHSDRPQLCHTSKSKCERPQLFFLQKKPPLATNHDDWDNETGYPIAGLTVFENKSRFLKLGTEKWWLKNRQTTQQDGAARYHYSLNPAASNSSSGTSSPIQTSSVHRTSGRKSFF